MFYKSFIFQLFIPNIWEYSWLLYTLYLDGIVQQQLHWYIFYPTCTYPDNPSRGGVSIFSLWTQVSLSKCFSSIDNRIPQKKQVLWLPRIIFKRQFDYIPIDYLYLKILVFVPCTSGCEETKLPVDVLANSFGQVSTQQAASCKKEKSHYIMTKESVQQEDIKTVHIDALITEGPKYIKEILIYLKGEMHCNTIIVENVTTHFQ